MQLHVNGGSAISVIRLVAAIIYVAYAQCTSVAVAI